MSDESSIDSILGEWRARRGSGEAVSRDELIRENPGLADSLRARFRAMDSHAATPPLRELPADRYAQFRVVGEGGMGIVYWAIDTDLNRQVAFKVVRPDTGTAQRPSTPAQPLGMALPAGDTPASSAFETLKARFLQEAWVTAGLEHPGIVPVYELGRTPEGVPYYTMRFVRGKRTLMNAIDDVKDAGAEARLALLDPFLRVCDAIRYAHAHGVIHRDLKPENVALGEYGEVVVLDWGLAKMTDRPDVVGETWRERIDEFRKATDLRTMASALGTPGYMSPEAALGRVAEVDARSDVYSLGAILFQILTGRIAFRFTTYGEFLRAVLDGDPPDARAVDPSVPPGLAALCARAMSKDRDRRPASVEALAGEIHAWRTERAAEIELEALLREADAAWTGAASLRGDALLQQLDHVRSVAERIDELRKGHLRAAELLAAVASARERAIVDREQAARGRVLRRAAVAGSVAAAVAACAVAWVIHGEKKQTEAALAAARNERDAKDSALTEKAQALEQARSERDAKQTALDEKSGALTRAEGLRLVAESTAAIDRNPTLALLLALEGNARVPGLVARNAVLSALAGLREERTLTGHEKPIRVLRLSPDGKRVLTASADGTARVWDADTGRALAVLSGHKGSVDRAVFTDGGAHVVTAGTDGTARTWDAATGKQIAVAGEETSSPVDVRLSPDGRRLMRTVSRTAISPEMSVVTVIDVETGRVVHEERGVFAMVPRNPFDPTGRRYVVSKFPAGTEIVDADGGGAPTVLRGGSFASGLTAFSDDGKLVLTAPAMERAVHLWDAATGKPLRVLDAGEETRPFAAAFSPDGTHLLTASTTARIWNVDSGEVTCVLRGHSSAVVDVAFSADGRLAATASDDGTARVWDASTGREVEVLRGHTGSVLGAVFSADGRRLITAGRDGTARIWRVTRLPEIAVFTGHDDVVATGAFSPDGTRVVTAGLDKVARVWDPEDGRELLALRGGNWKPKRPDALRQMMANSSEDAGIEQLTVATFSADGTQILACGVGANWATRVFDSATGAELFTGEEKFAHVASFSDDGRRCAETSLISREVRLWFLRENRKIVLHMPEAKTGERPLDVRGAVLCADGSHAVGFTASGPAVVWSADTGETLAVSGLTATADPVVNAAVSPDGRRIVYCGDFHGPGIWNWADKSAPAPLPGNDAPVRAVAFDRTGTRIVTGALDGEVRVCDAATGKPLAFLRGHEGRVDVAEFSRDGTRVVTAGRDGTARIWDAATGEEIVTLRGHTGRIISAAFDRDGGRVLTVSEDKTARIWPADVLAAARTRAPRELTPDERKRYEITAPR